MKESSSATILKDKTTKLPEADIVWLKNHRDQSYDQTAIGNAKSVCTRSD